jgi:hypothetical protein
MLRINRGRSSLKDCLCAMVTGFLMGCSLYGSSVGPTVAHHAAPCGDALPASCHPEVTRQASRIKAYRIRA